MYKVLTTFFILLLVFSCTTTDNIMDRNQIIQEQGFKNIIRFNINEKNIFSKNKNIQSFEMNEYYIIGELKEKPLTQVTLFGKKYDRYVWDGEVNSSNYNFSMEYNYDLTYLDSFEILSIEWSVDNNIIVKNFDLPEQSVKLPYEFISNRDSISVVIPKPMSNSFIADYMTYNSAKLIADKNQEFLFIEDGVKIAVLKAGVLYYIDNLSEKSKKLLVQYSSFCLSLHRSISHSIKTF